MDTSYNRNLCYNNKNNITVKNIYFNYFSLLVSDMAYATPLKLDK